MGQGCHTLRSMSVMDHEHTMQVSSRVLDQNSKTSLAESRSGCGVQLNGER